MRDKERVDEYVRAVVLERFRQPDAAVLLRPQESAADIDTARDRLRELEERQEDAAKGYAAGHITLAQLVAINDALNPQIEEARDAAAPAPEVPEEVQQLVEAPDPEPVWDALNPLQQRAVIGLLMDVRVLRTRRGPGFDPASVEIAWKK
jgi:hypothetical protein